MNEFPATLRSLLDLEGLGQVDLARSLGWSASKVSRILAGLVTVERDDVALLVAAVSTDRSRRIELLLAYLRDVGRSCHTRAGFDGRHYVIKAADESSSSLGGDLEFVAEMATMHPEIRDVIADLAKMLRRSQDCAERLSVYTEAEAADQTAKPKRGKS